MTITEILFELNSFTDAAAKRLYLDEHLADIIDELLAADDFDRETLVDKLTSSFDGTKIKGTIKKVIEAAIANKTKQESKKKVDEFSDVDIEKLVTKNGSIIATPSNYYELLLDPKPIDLLYDNMSASSYFSKICWNATTPPYTIEYYGGIIKHYHKYEGGNATMLRIVLNKGPFPTEIDFRGLDKVVEEVSKVKTFDAYQDWMSSYKAALDSNDYINGHDDNFAVKYLGVTPGQWSATWCRLIMLNLVARCYEPGCLTRYYFALEGEQNIGKSSWCRLLVPSQWFVATGLTQAQTNEDNFNRSIHDKAVVELAERGGLHKAESNLSKKIVTDPFSTFRKMRADPVIGYPKRCIMISTTNDNKYLNDPTGETRAMPIKSELASGQFIDLEGFAKVYPMILAQTIQMYENNKSLRFLTSEEQTLQKAQTNERDTIDDTFEYENTLNYIEENQEHCEEFGISIHDVMKYCSIKLDAPIHTFVRYRNAIGVSIRKLGYTEQHVAKEKDIDGVWRSIKRWKKPGAKSSQYSWRK
jgi:hypothetical protein